ncbi:hypothetical protein OENI_280020 [Oenococcus oeni]|nr:hypothetical protein OENI_280020 [Oenococcus oeni]
MWLKKQRFFLLTNGTQQKYTLKYKIDNLFQLTLMTLAFSVLLFSLLTF